MKIKRIYCCLVILLITSVYAQEERILYQVEIKDGPTFDELIEGFQSTVLPGGIVGILQGLVGAFWLNQEKDIESGSGQSFLGSGKTILCDIQEGVATAGLDTWRDHPEEFMQRPDTASAYMTEKVVQNGVKYLAMLTVADLFSTDEKRLTTKALAIEQIFSTLLRDRKMAERSMSKGVLNFCLRTLVEGMYAVHEDGKKKMIWSPGVGLASALAGVGSELVIPEIAHVSVQVNVKKRHRAERFLTTFFSSVAKLCVRSLHPIGYDVCELKESNPLLSAKYVGLGSVVLVGVGLLASHEQGKALLRGLHDVCRVIIEVLKIRQELKKK